MKIHKSTIISLAFLAVVYLVMQWRGHIASVEKNSRSIIGAMTIGINRKGRSCIARIRADAKVLPVSSKTRNASAKPPAIPPIVPIVDARITKLKFRFQSFVVVIFPSAYLFSSTIPDNSILLKV